MTQVPIAMELYVCAQLAQRLYPSLHHRWRGDAIAPTDDDEGRGLVGGVPRMAGVGHHHR